MRRRLSHPDLLLVIAASAVALLAAEGMVRLLWRPDAETSVIEPHPLYGWALRPGSHLHSVASDRGLDYHIAVNALGLRDRERSMARPAGVHRVLFLGDSMVFGAGVETGDRLTERLEAALAPGVEAINAGVSGWGVDQEFLWLCQAGFALHPQVVVVGLCVLNDVLNDLLPHELFGAAPKPYFELHDGVLVLVPPAPRALPSPGRRATALLQHSRLLHFVGRHMRFLMARLQRPVPAAGRPYYPEDLESDASHWAVFRRTYSPRFEAAFQVTEALLAALHDSCTARGISLVVFAFPQKVEVDARDRALELAHYGYDAAQFDLEAPYTRLAATVAKMSVPWLYPLAEWRAAASDARLFFARDGHPNATGHALAAAELEPVIRDVLEHSVATRR